MTLKRTMCALLAATMLVPTAVVGEIAASAAEVDVSESSATVSEESSAAGYGLANSIQEGTILHCFDWKYSDITAELPNIAAAGFTSVQTSPVQQPAGTGTWYWLYQPLGFYIPDSQPLGTKAELKTLCDTAEQYGIKVVVDVVANHLAGDHSSIQSDLKDSQYWHNMGSSIDYSNRWSITHGDLGMPDINSEHSYVQQVVRQYLVDLQNIGVDGYRFDAAKHIGLPSEDCAFWSSVLPSGTYSYGEILDGPGGSNNESLMKEYTNYISVTDDSYGKTLLNSFAGGNATTSIGNWSERGISKNKLVYWAESHDTYSNDGEYGSNTAYNTQNQVDRAYAVVAAQDKASSLYFSRPFSTSKESIKMAVKGSTHFTSPEVAEVNKFHNAMNGTKEYYTTGSNCSVVCRGNGAVIVAGSGGNFEVTVPNGGGTTAAGTYTDQVSGGTWTVTSSTISGKIGESGIAVLYSSVPVPAVSATPSSGTSFTDTLTVTLNATNVTSATYKTSEGASGSYTDGKTIVVGASTAEGGSVTLDLTGTDSDGKTVTNTYKYTKKGGLPVLDGAGFIFDNSSTNWSTVYAYVYDESGSSVVNNAEWPGFKMTDCGDGYWKYELDSKFSSSSSVQVIFSNGNGTQIPGSQQPGYTMSTSDKKIYEGGTWKDAPASSSLKVSLAASKSSVNVGDSVTLTATATGASGTVTYTFSDGSTQIQSSTKNTASWSPSTAGSHTIKCVITDSTGKTATVSKTFTAEGTDSDTDSEVSTLKNNSTVSASSVTVGTTVTITGKAIGGTGSYQYAFYYKRGSATSWTTKAAYGSATSVTLTPAYADTYTIRVDAKDSNGTVVSKTLTVTSNEKVELKNNSTVSSTAVNVGDTVTITGKATGGTGSYQYAFYYKRGSATSWTTKAAYGSATSVTLTPAYADTYTVKVDVKDSSGTVVSKTFTITSTVAKALSNDSTISKTTANIGDTITITGKASGGKGSYKYAYYYKRSSMSTWMTKGTEYGTTTSVTLTPAYNETYQVMVNVMDSEGTIKSKIFTVTVGSTTLTNKSTVSATSVKVGTTITITGAASGGTSPYQYAFYYKKGSATSWTTKSAYGKATSVELTPVTATTYTVRVDAKDNNGTVSSKTFTINVSEKETLTNSSTISATSVKKGTAVTITGKSSGGTGTVQYAFYYKKSGESSWTTKSAYGKATSVTLTPAYVTTYTIKVDAKDSAGTVVSKTFTVKATS